ncbi:uncharacterized protein EI97DRAFT_443207 [Westerdykella ornata]|uniref:Uncharacterized protein n=1 Tax=Westerdykella ornata TaxID=318751 RepID=A0A6A6JKC9_WESOR|nr:uncharacterized protein EI97DRAFT_443207 [Westerdykella ornata]KAF2275339.1 hypothetical protein EI97DRAFT_443207 [Westerdykella ornata]
MPFTVQHLLLPSSFLLLAPPGRRIVSRIQAALHPTQDFLSTLILGRATIYSGSIVEFVNPLRYVHVRLSSGSDVSPGGSLVVTVTWHRDTFHRTFPETARRACLTSAQRSGIPLHSTRSLQRRA